MQNIVFENTVCSKVEKIALETSTFKLIYPPTEKVPAIVVENFPVLGKLAAMRFIEWVQNNPEGVISLPTGKTPEYFIKWVNHLLHNWDNPQIQKELECWALNPATKPDMKGLYFVQIDEFYPIDSSQTNSFYYYVNKFFIKGFELDPKRALLINASKIGLKEDEDINNIWPEKRVDLTLRYRHPKTLLENKQKAVLQRIDQWCMEYEDKIQKLGGIGFFLGGIGPDGHIGFNISGSDHHSTTRLCPINYETQAAAATDLGGIETARKCLVITIGLHTITQNENCTAIIIVAGEAKASIVSKTIQSEKDINVPVTALQFLPNAKFYLARGAASQLIERRLHMTKSQKTFSDQEIEKILIDLAVTKGKRLLELNEEDFKKDRFALLVLERRKESVEKLTQKVYQSIVEKIERGMQTHENTCFLHTEPHHDDIMLGCFAHIVRNFRRASNTHYFMTLTSGFTSVTNHFMASQVRNLKDFLNNSRFIDLYNENYFEPSNLLARNRDVWQYLDGVAAQNDDMKNEGHARRLLRNIIEISESNELQQIKKYTDDLEEYFITQYPGKIDPPYIQKLKGMCREWEAECLWGYYGWKCDNVKHLRLGFYTGNIFSQEPDRQRDIVPIVKELEKIKPDIITVALDPEATGPDTHYKCLQALSEALHIYEEKGGKSDIKLWGYRNVWHRFDPSEANIYVPVSLCMFSVMQQAFWNAFNSQRDASFPSYEYDGPFSELAQLIQVEQFQQIENCLGRKWFNNHSIPLIGATRGLLFLKEMELQEFYTSCRKLREFIENLKEDTVKY
ncbi:glucosamine-6-phosphate deaminase [Planctomycetota bacterium]